MANSFVHIVPLSFASIINGLFGSSTSRFPFTFFLWLSLAFTFCVLLCFDSRFNASVLLHSFTSLLFFCHFLSFGCVLNSMDSLSRLLFLVFPYTEMDANSRYADRFSFCKCSLKFLFSFGDLVPAKAHYDTFHGCFQSYIKFDETIGTKRKGDEKD